MALCHDVIPCPVGDHDLVTATLNLSKPKRQPTIKTFRQLKHYSPNVLCNILLERISTLEKIFKTDNVNDQLDECALVTKEVKRPLASYINDNLRALIHRRNCAQTNLKIDRNNTHLQNVYKKLKQDVRAALHQAKSEYYTKTLEDCRGNSRETWRVLRELVLNAKKKTTAGG